MEIIKVYHGCDHVLKQPLYLGGKADNDYGNGFYTTEYEDRARSWAVLNGNPDKAVVNVYELKLDNLRVLDLNECGVLAWIAEVVKNRGVEQENAQFIGNRLVELYCHDTSEFDIIKGYRADDSYTQVIEAFLLNQINVSEVERLFYKGSLGNQIFLKSSRAFQNISWKAAYHVKREECYTENDFYARKEVNRLLYHKEGGYYEHCV